MLVCFIAPLRCEMIDSTIEIRSVASNPSILIILGSSCYPLHKINNNPELLLLIIIHNTIICNYLNDPRVGNSICLALLTILAVC